ncbi:MAG: Asp-tRNA(Asn)/Glu-tRNA(Gln) amidotransferase subunit GatC [Coriobacteriales bacterium]|nr:Asp-tRNA(Asn)/Glu-tRNA(Gln) amidotransferase subunit GatC [Coriobacteriales bacterium]
MPLSEKDVRAIADYARIGIADEDLPQMTEDLNNMISSLDAIKEFDLEGVEPTFHPIGDLSNVLREDVVAPSLPREVALSDAAETEDWQFRVPSILGGDQ